MNFLQNIMEHLYDLEEPARQPLVVFPSDCLLNQSFDTVWGESVECKEREVDSINPETLEASEPLNGPVVRLGLNSLVPSLPPCILIVVLAIFCDEVSFLDELLELGTLYSDSREDYAEMSDHLFDLRQDAFHRLEIVFVDLK